jgi:WD40 repeat protein
LLGYDGLARALAFSPDGQRLVVVGAKGGVMVWETTTWQATRLLGLASADGRCTAAFSPDGRQLAVAGFGSSFPIVVLDVSTGAQIQVLHGHTWVVRQLAFSPNGRHLASASNDGTVRVWDVRTGKEVGGPPPRIEASVIGVAFSPDGQRLATASLDGAVRVWDATSWRLLLVLREVTGGLWCVAFSADGRRLAWGSSDATVKVADADTGQVTATLRGHNGWVQSVAFSPDGLRIASASTDGTVKIWQTPPVPEPAAGEARKQNP